MANLIVERADDIIQRAVRQLASSTQVTRFSPGSKAKTLVGIMAGEIEALENRSNANLIMSLLAGASGQYLDFLGDLVGVPRTIPASASASQTSAIIEIFTPEGLTAGDLNSGNSITIPGGTVIQSSDGLFRYVTTGTVILPSGDSVVTVSARSIKEGSQGNLSALTLDTIRLEGYSTFPSIQLSVRNVASIENGTDVESHDLYRFRIQNAFLSAERANRTAVRLAALTVPSVSDIIVLDLFRGIGTADLILDTETGQVNSQTIEQVRGRLFDVAALGMDIQVRGPKLIGLSVTIRPRYTSAASAVQRQQANAAVRQTISGLVAQTPIGGSLLINDIAVAAKGSSPFIIDIGQPNRPLEQVIIWRDSVISGRTPLMVSTTKDIELAVDQRLTMEGSLSEAIRVVQ